MWAWVTVGVLHDDQDEQRAHDAPIHNVLPLTLVSEAAILIERLEKRGPDLMSGNQGSENPRLSSGTGFSNSGSE
jgi:hypothetical protein